MRSLFRNTSVGTALAIGGLLAAAPAAGAQAGGPYAPIVLLLPSSTRALGMGDLNVLGRDDDVLFANPAQLAVARAELSLSGERYASTAGGGTMSALTRIGNGGVAIGYQTVSYEGTQPIFPADRASMLDLGASATSSIVTAGIGQTFKGLHIGAAVKYVDDNTPNLPESWTAADIGLSKDFGRSFGLGLAVQNIGPATSVDCASAREAAPFECAVIRPPSGQPFLSTTATTIVMPLRTTLGAAGTHEAGPFDLAWTAGASLLRKDFLIPAGGLELGYSWLDGYDIALRAGARRPLPGEHPVTAGAALSVDRVSIDYALEPLTGGHIGHRLGIRIR